MTSSTRWGQFALWRGSLQLLCCLVCGCPASPASDPTASKAKPTGGIATASSASRVAPTAVPSGSANGQLRIESLPEAVAPTAPVKRAPHSAQIETLLSLGPEASTSLGTPVAGRLRSGVELPLSGPGFRFNSAKSEDNRYGTVEMVQALVRAAAQVAEGQPPGASLVVGELSRQVGGDIAGHVSHRSGRDVDLLYFLRDAQDKPFPAKAIPLEPDGTGVDYRDLSDAADDLPVHLDTARTWALFESLLTEPHSAVGRIFLVEHIRTMLLEHAHSVGAPQLAIERFSELTCQPKYPHDDHAHLRWFCSIDDIAAGCEDTRPIYPWHRAHLAAHGVAARIAGKRKTARARVTSPAQAEARAKKRSGSFDAAVVEFLQRRKGWLKQPHPGRPYCQ